MAAHSNVLTNKLSLSALNRKKWRKIWIPYAFMLPFILLFVVFKFVPAVFGIGLSFAKWELMEGTQKFVGLRNFMLLMTDQVFWISMRNSLIIATVSTIGIVLLAMSTAVGLRAIKWGQTFFRVFLYLPTILAISVVGIIWSRALSTNGLFNYFIVWLRGPVINFLGDPNIVLFTLSGVTIWWSFGFPMLTLLAGLYSIPNSLYEAAMLDGANGWQSFFHISLPLVRPALLFVTLTQFIGHFQVFGQAYVLTKGGPGYSSYPVILYLYQNAWRYYHMGYASSIAVSVALVLLVVTVLQMRFLGQRVEF